MKKQSIKCFLIIALLLQSCFSFTEEEVITVPCTPSATGASTLSFSYSGSLNGATSANGELPSSYYTGKEFAMAFAFSEYGEEWILIESFNPTDTISISFTIQDNGIGNSSLMGPGASYGSVLTIADEQLSFISGGINITDYFCDRIKGTFQGDLKHNHIDSTTVLRIYDGVFDLKMIPH